MLQLHAGGHQGVCISDSNRLVSCAQGRLLEGPPSAALHALSASNDPSPQLMQHDAQAMRHDVFVH